MQNNSKRILMNFFQWKCDNGLREISINFGDWALILFGWASQSHVLGWIRGRKDSYDEKIGLFEWTKSSRALGSRAFTEQSQLRKNPQQNMCILLILWGGSELPIYSLSHRIHCWSQVVAIYGFSVILILFFSSLLTLSQKFWNLIQQLYRSPWSTVRDFSQVH